MLNSFATNVPAYLRVYVKEYPLLWKTARFFGQSTKGEVSTLDTDVCVEGFESSSNSFVVNVMRNVTESIRIAHHCHTVASVKVALSKGVDTIILFRDPRDAIASTVARFRPGIMECLFGYIKFYEYVYRVRRKVLLISFEESTERTEEMISRIQQHVNLGEVEYESVDALEKRVKEQMVAWQEKHSDASTLPLPKSNRAADKAQVKKDLGRWPAFKRAQEVYERITEAYNEQKEMP